MSTSIIIDVEFFDQKGKKTENLEKAITFTGNISGGLIRGYISSVDFKGHKIKIGNVFYRFIPKDIQNFPLLEVTDCTFSYSNFSTSATHDIEWAKSKLSYGHKLYFWGVDTEMDYSVYDLLWDIIIDDNDNIILIGENGSYRLI